MIALVLGEGEVWMLGLLLQTNDSIINTVNSDCFFLMPRGNPESLTSFPKIAPEGSAPKSVAVRIPKSQYEIWMSLSSEERNECLRDAITQKLVEKNLISA